MTLSRKRERELKRLKHSASELWEDQREVLEHASKVVREAGRQAGYVGREEVVPRVRDTIDHRIKPTVASGISATRSAAEHTRDKISHEVVPSVASAIASALAVIEVAKDARVKQAIREIRRASDSTTHLLDTTNKKTKKAAKKYSKKLSTLPPQKKSHGPGGYIALGVGLVALAGLGYAVWQTLRADDDLWITDETDDFTKPESL